MPKTDNQILDDFIKERFLLEPNDDLRESVKDLTSFALYRFRVRFGELKQEILKTPPFRFMDRMLRRII